MKNAPRRARFLFRRRDGTLVAFLAAGTRRSILAFTFGDAMPVRLLLLLSSVLVLAACSNEPVSPEQRAADQCRLFRGYMSTQEPQYVIEACTRQMGEAACRECLSR
jgi:hypothetical protein